MPKNIFRVESVMHGVSLDVSTLRRLNKKYQRRVLVLGFYYFEPKLNKQKGEHQAFDPEPFMMQHR